MALEEIQPYVQELFPNLAIKEIELEQLTWSIRSPGQTPEKDIVKTISLPEFEEVRRALSRLYCLELMYGGVSNYQAFIANQPVDDKYLPHLSYEEFEGLVKNFANLDKLTIEALRVSTIISSVTLSPKARGAAEKVLGRGNYNDRDSVEFLADTFKDTTKAREIYPLVDDLYQRYPEPKDSERITSLLQASFASRQHYRHMLYTEGNQVMFTRLIAKIKAALSAAEETREQQLAIVKEQFNQWKKHWAINKTGFRGHLDAHGALYYTSNTFRSAQALNNELEKIFTEPDVTGQQILERYLDVRAGKGFLQLTDVARHISVAEKRFFAHIGAMLRLFHPDEGKALVAAFDKIAPEVTQELAELYFTVPAENELTPTFAPALYENALDYAMKIRGLARLEAIEQAVLIIVPINLAALKNYKESNCNKSLAPLSFKKLADKGNIAQLFSSAQEVYIDAQGEANIRPKPQAEVTATSSSEAEKDIAGFSSTFTPAFEKKRDVSLVAGTEVTSEPLADPKKEKRKKQELSQ